MQGKTLFVTGFSSVPVNQAVNVNKTAPPTPPATTVNTNPTSTLKATITMTRPTDAALLRELASKSAHDSAFAINTNDLQGAAARLREAASYVDRLISATSQSGIHGNAGHRADEFAGYSINDPMGEQAATVKANAGAGEFAGYDLNSL